MKEKNSFPCDVFYLEGDCNFYQKQHNTAIAAHKSLKTIERHEQPAWLQFQILYTGKGAALPTFVWLEDQLANSGKRDAHGSAPRSEAEVSPRF